MVNKSTPLNAIFTKMWKTPSNQICGVLKTDFDGYAAGNKYSMTIGRYCDSLLNRTGIKERLNIPVENYRLIEGINDETGIEYRVISEIIPMKDNKESSNTNESLNSRLNEMSDTIYELAVQSTLLLEKLGAEKKRGDELEKRLNEFLSNLKSI